MPRCSPWTRSSAATRALRALRRLFAARLRAAPAGESSFEDMHWADPATGGAPRADWPTPSPTARAPADPHASVPATGPRSPSARSTRGSRSPRCRRPRAPRWRARCSADEPPARALARAHRRQGRGQSVLRRGAGPLAARDGRGPARRATGVVLARGVDEIVVPDTVQDVIMARLDRLDEAPLSAFQVASVIGRDFACACSSALAGRRRRARRSVGELEPRADLREGAAPELGLHVQARADARRRLRSSLAERRRALHLTIGARHRGALRRPARRALRGPRAPLLPRRGLGARRARTS